MLEQGAIDGDRISFTMNANDQLFSADQYKNLIIGEKNGGRAANIIKVIA
jgi:hypothetical protein